MAAGDKRVTVILGADVAPYVAGVKTASDVTVQLVGSIEKAGRASQVAGATVTRGTEEMHRGFSRSALAASLMEGNLRQVATTAAGFFAGSLFIRGTQAIVSGIKGVIQAGADMNETLSKTQFAFGPGAAIIIQQANQLGRSLGVNRQTFTDSATQIGLIGKAAGYAGPQAAAMGAHFARLAVDVSSFYNVPVGDALAAISSGLVGQERPLRQYGVLLDQASVKAEAMRLGIADASGQLTEGQAIMARASLITKGFNDASGDLERTQGSLANRLRAISGHIHNFAIDLGSAAQPALVGLLTAAGNLGSRGLDVLSAAAARLAPFWRNLVAIGRDLGPLFVNVARAVTPLAGALGSIAGTPIVATLTAVAAVLRPIADLISNNRVVADALAALLVAKLVPGLIGMASGIAGVGASLLGTFAPGLAAAVTGTTAVATTTAVAGEQLTLFGAEAAGAAEQLTLFDVAEVTTVESSGLLTGALGRLGGALAGIGPIPVIGLGLVLLGQQMGDAKRKADALLSSLKSGHDLSTTSGLTAYRDQLQALVRSTDDLVHSQKNIGGFHKSDLATQLAEQKNWGIEIQRVNGLLAHQERALGDVAKGTGLTKDQVLNLAKANGVDLTTADNAAIQSLIQLGIVAKSTGLALDDAAKSRQDAIVKGNQAALDTSGILSTIVDRHNQIDSAAKKSGGGETEEQRQHKIASAYLGVAQAQQQVVAARLKLDALQNGGQDRELAAAYRDRAAAIDGVTRADYSLLEAEQKLADLEESQRSGRTLDELNIALQRAKIQQDRADLAVRQASDKLAYAKQVGIPAEVKQSQDEYNSALLDQREASYGVLDAQTAVNRATGEQGTIARNIATAQLDVAAASRSVADANDAQVTSSEKLNELANGGLVREMAAAQLDLQQALAGVATAQDAVATALTRSNDAADAAVSKFDIAKVSLAEFRAELEKQITATLNWNVDLAKLPDDVASYFRQMGVQSAPLLHQLVTTNQGEFDRIVSDIRTSTALGSDVFAQNLDAMRTNGIGIMLDAGGKVGGALVESLGSQSGPLFDVIKGFLELLGVNVNALMAAIGKPQIPSLASLVDTSRQATYSGPGTPLISGGYMGHAQGGIDSHIVNQPTVLYGERQTGGEAFIPRHGSPVKMKQVMATAASWYGMRVTPMASGGILPTPPDVGAYGYMLGGGGAQTMNFAYEQAMSALAAKQASMGGIAPGNPVGEGWRAITAHLDAARVPYTITSTTGGSHVQGSLHYLGKAVDLVGRAGSSMAQIFNALAAPGGQAGPVKGINELFYDPMGYYYDLGKYRAGQIGGHRDHVHAATFDRGGWLQPGTTIARNNTGQPEWVNGPGGGGRPLNLTIEVNVPSGVITDVPTFSKAMSEVAQVAGDAVLDALHKDGRTR